MRRVLVLMVWSSIKKKVNRSWSVEPTDASIAVVQSDVDRAMDWLMNEPDETLSNPERIFYCWEALLRIRTSDGIKPLIANNTQKAIVEVYSEQKGEEQPVRMTNLKGRQQGATTGYTALTALELIARPGIEALIATNKKSGASTNLWNMLTRYFLMWGGELKDRREVFSVYNRYAEFKLPNDSLLRTVAQEDVLSFTTDVVHISEAGYFDNLTEWLSHLLPSVKTRHGTSIFIESTAKEYGDGFHDQWNRASTGISGFFPLFNAWYIHEDNVLPLPKDEKKADKIRESFGTLEKYGDELQLMRDYDLTAEQLYFRRDRIDTNGSIVEFQREYPATPDEAFLHAESPAIDPASLLFMQKNWVKPHVLRFHFETTDKCEMPARHYERVETHAGAIDILEPPKPHVEYVIGSDHAKGEGEGDWNAALVMRRDPFETVAKLRGNDSSKLSAYDFAEQLYQLGQYYNDAHWLGENNGEGAAIINLMYDWDYPNIMTMRDVFGKEYDKKDRGWNNNRRTRFIATSLLIKALQLQFDDEGQGKADHELMPIIRDEETILELMHVVWKGKKIEAKRKGEYRRRGESQIGFYDDLVFALIGCMLAQQALDLPLSVDEKIVKDFGVNSHMASGVPESVKRKYRRKRKRKLLSPNAWRAGRPVMRGGR